MEKEEDEETSREVTVVAGTEHNGEPEPDTTGCIWKMRRILTDAVLQEMQKIITLAGPAVTTQTKPT
ncbi:hypothetical protein GDO78_019292 [Eleutherodactylus coqui]|uniref:Uncharacterized protein n=1 Tax=Eleutherodactylus coqui TaxID=57060 RepID=A0A8J6B7Z7_ELECQ|nr:hypothetical protein GDO78_019292 [Eleutherodactylus coqui]